MGSRGEICARLTYWEKKRKREKEKGNSVCSDLATCSGY